MISIAVFIFLPPMINMYMAIPDAIIVSKFDVKLTRESTQPNVIFIF